MGSVVLNGATSGATTITPTDAVTATVTLPSTGGTLQTSGSGFTTNGVAYASSTSALATGSALTWDGSILKVSASANEMLRLDTSSTSYDAAIRLFQAGVQKANIQAGVGVTGGGLQITSTTSTPIVFQTNGEAGRFDSSGNLLVGTTSASVYVNTTKFTSVQQYTSDSNTTTLSTQRAAGVFWIDGGASSNNQGSYCAIVASASTGASSNPGAIFRGYGNVNGGTLNVQINYNGNITNTNNSYGAISDVSLKENIVDATPKLDDLLQVKVRQYNLKADEKKIKQLGVVAQELETVFPAMIEKDSEGIKSVKYSVFVPMLIKSIQELSTLITAQQSTIQSLTERITALEGART